MGADTQVKELLRRAREGDSSAPAELIPLLYAELRHSAARYLRWERPGHTLQPNALVNEVYLRMLGNVNASLVDKAHFLALASRIMRRILVDYARTRGAEKRGGNANSANAFTKMEFSVDNANPLLLLDIDLAIDALAEESPLLAQAVELHYFGGLTAEAAAEATGRTVHAARHDLRLGMAWLRRRMAGDSRA